MLAQRRRGWMKGEEGEKRAVEKDREGWPEKQTENERDQKK